MDEHDEQPAMTRHMDGTVVQFLRRNYFLVQLRDRQVIAAMPERLLPVGAQFKELSPGESIHVKVRLRKPPRMARIVSARRSSLCG
jgi:hypothetical protein